MSADVPFIRLHTPRWGYTGVRGELARGGRDRESEERAMAGVFGGMAATLVLSGLREALTRFELVFESFLRLFTKEG
jgi:hypothetical protein